MRVLIADDERDAVDSLSMLCEAWGFEPDVAYDGSSALAKLRQPNAPMLCLLDWQMPGLTGVEICAEVRREKDRPYRYIILITGRTARTERLAGLNAGADDFLFKPVDPDELRARLMTGTRVLNLQDQLLRAMKQLKEQASRDGQTRLWNRTAIFETLHREMARGHRHENPLSIALVDIDLFKGINDRHGHLVGDLVIANVAKRLVNCVRPYDSVGRYGGEEFLIVLPGCNSAEANALSERLRRAIQDESIDAPDLKLQTTVSIGVATWAGEAEAVDFVRRADEALYLAKNTGRNRVAHAAH